MKIHFTCSTAEFNKYRDDYFFIRNYLISQGHLLTRDWLPHTEQRILANVTDIRDIKKIYKENIQALREAHLVIIEDTVSNFSTGHQITLAVQMRKPTLVLWQGKKYRQFKQMFIHGIESNLLQVTEYQPSELEDILKSFISKYEHIKETNRFHLVLNGVERQYLDWAQFNKNKSRTQVIKDALHDAIQRDTAYEEYLLGYDSPVTNIQT